MICFSDHFQYFMPGPILHFGSRAQFFIFWFQGPFSNMPEFGRDWKCREGSRMNPVKETKCSVWWSYEDDFCPQLDPFDTSWIHFTPVGTIWHQLEPFDTSWNYLTPVVTFWHRLKLFDTRCNHLTPVGTIWHQLEPLDPSWCKKENREKIQSRDLSQSELV